MKSKNSFSFESTFNLLPGPCVGRLQFVGRKPIVCRQETPAQSVPNCRSVVSLSTMAKIYHSEKSTMNILVHPVTSLHFHAHPCTSCHILSHPYSSIFHQTSYIIHHPSSMSSSVKVPSPSPHSRFSFIENYVWGLEPSPRRLRHRIC